MIDTRAMSHALTEVQKELLTAQQALNRARDHFAMPGHAALYLPDDGQQAILCSRMLLDTAAEIMTLRRQVAQYSTIGLAS